VVCGPVDQGRTTGDHHVVDYDPLLVAEVFGRAAPSYDTVIPFFARFGERLVDFAYVRAGERVLDVGCGQGATLFPAAARVAPGGEVLGVDLSVEMVAMLGDEIGRRGTTNASVRRMNAEELDMADASFDLAIASFVLHLVPDPGRVASCLLRALREGGRCAASAPVLSGTGWEFLGALLKSFATRATRPMDVPFRLDFDLPAVLASAGFDLTRVTEEELVFHFADEQAWWTWAWSGGLRAAFEVLTPADLEDLRHQVFVELALLRTPDGIPMVQRATFVAARKPTHA